MLFKFKRVQCVYALLGSIGALSGIVSVIISFINNRAALPGFVLMLLCNAFVTLFSKPYAQACTNSYSPEDIILPFWQQRTVYYLSDLFLVTMWLSALRNDSSVHFQKAHVGTFLLLAMIGKYLLDLIAFGQELYRHYSVIKLENAYADGYVVYLNGRQTEAPIEFSEVHNSSVEFNISKANKAIYVLAKEDDYTEIMEEICASKIVRSGIYHTTNCSFCCTFSEVAEKVKVPVLWLQARIPVIEKLLYDKDSVLDVQVFEKEQTIDIIFCADAVCAICEGGDCETCGVHDMMGDSDDALSVCKQQKSKDADIKEAGEENEEK